MQSQLSVLVGRQVVSAKTDPGEWGLFFGDATLSINNPVKISGVPEVDLPNGLEGLLLEGVLETEGRAILQFSDGVTLEIDLSDDAYTGPEAMVLTKPDGAFVVWN